jgi:hypothetical protein
MANSKGSALAIIAFIIGAGGLGIGIYTIFFSPPGVVAIWDSLYGGGDNFDIAARDIQITHNKYFSISTDNTTITLTKSGWYEFTIRTTFYSLSAADRYTLELQKNGVSEAFFVYLNYPASTYWEISSSVFVQSDGDDEFVFNCESSGSDTFFISANQDYNQLILEFVE